MLWDANHTVIESHELACRHPPSLTKAGNQPEQTEYCDNLTLSEMTLPGFAITAAARIQAPRRSSMFDEVNFLSVKTRPIWKQ
jgi:hypothetical protein